jgi:serine/threonine protein kinase
MSVPGQVQPISGRQGTAPVLAIGPGAMLGRYQVLSHVAAGGMAEIYLARAVGLEGFERYVVVKCIKPEHARDERFVKMFIDEARVSAHLHHQNIAQVYDIGQEGGAYYFAMEYLHGENVREVLHRVATARGEVPLDHALTIVCGAAAGLHYAHEKRAGDGQPLGIVHRDVSPSNIVVTFDGAVKVVDFGIAKAAMRMTETQSGNLKGKIAYMSPEQCRGTAVDRRSDVFALGIVLYELTTVTRLFRGASDYVMMNKIVTGDIEPPSARRAGYPPLLEAIVMRALANKPEDRYASAAEMRDDLVAFAKGAGVSLSTIGLERYVRELFGERPEPWANQPTPTPTPSGDETADAVAPLRISSGTVTSQGSLAMSALEVASAPPPRGPRTALILTAAVLVSAALIAGAAMFKSRARHDEPATTVQPVIEPSEPALAIVDAGVDADVELAIDPPAMTPDAMTEPPPPTTDPTPKTSHSSRTHRSSRSSSASNAASPSTATPPPAAPPATDAGIQLRDPRKLRPED